MKDRQKEKKGITLIWLVITIIAFLVVVGVVILTGGNQTERKSSDQKEEISQETIQGNNNNNENATKELEKHKDRITDISKLKIGDYVEYYPTPVTTSYDKFGETYSGYSNEQIEQDKNLKWRILNIKEDGIDLVCDEQTSAMLYLQGARGYNNGVYLLNDYCKTMYSNETIGAVARSLNIEDIQDKMITINGKKAYETNKCYECGKNHEYGKTTSYQYSKYYPLQWNNDNELQGRSKSNSLQEYKTEDDAICKDHNGDLTVAVTHWSLDKNTMETNFEQADTRDKTKANSMYYELLCAGGSSNYWLASRSVLTTSTDSATVGLQKVDYGIVAVGGLYHMDKRIDSESNYIRPVVSLPANVINTDVEYNDETGWSL